MCIHQEFSQVHVWQETTKKMLGDLYIHICATDKNNEKIEVKCYKNHLNPFCLSIFGPFSTAQIGVHMNQS